MTNEERDQAIAWFQSRKSGTVMPGANRMYQLALEALQSDPKYEDAGLPTDTRAEAEAKLKGENNG